MREEITQALKRFLPKPLKKPFKKVRVLYYQSGNRRRCPLCTRTFREFMPFGKPLPVSVELKIVSAMIKERGMCIYCTSQQRQRLLWLYLSQQGLVETIPEKEILHFAPEQALFRKLQGVAKRYVCADIAAEPYGFCENLEIQNITQLGYAEGSFDWVICNHVLEHIIDDGKAMAELFRVLKRGGMAFLTVPIGLVLRETREDPTITSPEERERLFGQHNHVRVYTRKDFIARLQQTGFEVTPACPTLTDAEEDRYGLTEKEEEVFVCVKP